jgi:hypothetical protein
MAGQAGVRPRPVGRRSRTAIILAIRPASSRYRSAGRDRQGRCKPRPPITCLQSQIGLGRHLRR